MNRNALLAAIACAAVGAALLIVYKRRFERETSGGPKVAVLVANQDIPFGGTLDASMLSERGVPVAYLETRHIRSSDARRVIGSRVSRGVRANEAVLWSDLAISGDGARTLAETIQPGMRALAVPATITSTFGGLLRPGDRVDAFLTTIDRDVERRTTLPLLQNLLVLAVGGDVGMAYEVPEHDPRDDHRPPSLKLSTVTLGVTPRQAEVLTFAQDQGVMTLALRHPDDVVVVDGLPEATRSDLLSPERREELQRKRPAAPPPPRAKPEDRPDAIEAVH
jgi:pilus assembly protein CpaB